MSAGSERYDPDNILDRMSARPTLERFYRHQFEREHALVARRLALSHGEVLSVGAGWHPGRHLFPSPSFHLTAVDADPDRVAGVTAADRAILARAGELELEFEPGSFDVVLYRLVLHHLAYHGPIDRYFGEAARLLRPGGSLIAIEPGLWHPVGLGLALANRLGLATAIHGTPDDVPLSPASLRTAASRAGLAVELHSVSYGWRRLPPAIERAIERLDAAIGSRPRAASFGHTLMLIATRRC